MLLNAKNLTYAYGAKKVLNRLSFHLEAGERIGLAGVSGSGKSTLLKVLAGELAVQKGELRYKNQAFEVQRKHLVPGHEEIKLLGQNFDLSPNLTVDENITKRGRQLSTSRLKKHLGRSHRMLSLGSFKNQKAKLLSGGQKQRAALAATLAARPNLLLLDEPFNQLDYYLKLQVLEYLNQDYPELTRIMVSHEPTDLLAYSSRIVILQGGKIVQDASPFEAYHFPVNEYAAALTGFYNVLNPLQQQLLKTEEKIIRPQHLKVQTQGISAQVKGVLFNGFTTLLSLSLKGDAPGELLYLNAGSTDYSVGDILSIALKKPSKKEGF